MSQVNRCTWCYTIGLRVIRLAERRVVMEVEATYKTRAYNPKSQIDRYAWKKKSLVRGAAVARVVKSDE